MTGQLDMLDTATADRREFTITCVRRHPEGRYWTAHVTAGERTVPVDRQHGSWQTTPGRGIRRAHVLPHIAAALQDRVRPLERKERS